MRLFWNTLASILKMWLPTETLFLPVAVLWIVCPRLFFYHIFFRPSLKLLIVEHLRIVYRFFIKTSRKRKLINICLFSWTNLQSINEDIIPGIMSNKQQTYQRCYHHVNHICSFINHILVLWIISIPWEGIFLCMVHALHRFNLKRFV